MIVDSTSCECSAGIGAVGGAGGTIATTFLRDSGIDTARWGTTIFGRVSWKCSVEVEADVGSSPATATYSVDKAGHDVRKIVNPMTLRATPKHIAMRCAAYDNPLGVADGYL